MLAILILRCHQATKILLHLEHQECKHLLCSIQMDQNISTRWSFCFVCFILLSQFTWIKRSVAVCVVSVGLWFTVMQFAQDYRHSQNFLLFLSLWKQSVKMVPALSEVSSEICLEHQSSKISRFLEQAYRMTFIPHVSIASWSMCFSCAFKPIWPIFLPARALHFKSFVACVR